MKNKYNWDRIKLDYYVSPIMEVKDFFEYTYSTYTGHTKAKTKGWTKEKKEFIQSCKSQAEDNIRKRMAKMYEPSREEISQMYEAVMLFFQAKLMEWTQSIKEDKEGIITVPDNIKVSDVKIVWEIMRTERGLPIKYKQADININIREEKKQVFFY